MLIPQLVALAHREALLDNPLFEKKVVRWQVMLGPGGEFVGVQALGDNRGLELMVPKKVGGNAGGIATFGTDNARFVLGLGSEAQKATRDLAAFAALVQRASAAFPTNKGFAAARDFYQDSARVEAARMAAVAVGVKEADRAAIAFLDDVGQNLFETDDGKAFWRQHRGDQEATRPHGEAVQCLSCGQLQPAVKTNDTKIMGVPGGQPSGTALVSFDKEAFQSHGWDKNENAPVCGPCSQAYTRALNHLLRRDVAPQTRADIAGTVFVVWSDAGPIPFLDEIEDPNHDSAPVPDAELDPTIGVDTLVAAFCRHKLPPKPPDARLFALSLKGNGGRAVITDWFDATLGEAWQNLRRWFDDIQVRLIFPESIIQNGERVTVRDAGELSRPRPLRVLARATARDFDDIDRRVPAALLRGALHGEPLPQTVLRGCLERLPRDGFGDSFAPARLGLIRCYLNRSPIRKGKELMPGLDPTSTEPAYICGRLMATLETVQFHGVGDVGANVVDRFYGRASTAPALVFGQLLKLAQSHLGSMNEKPGVRTALEKELQEILSQLDAGLPRTLDSEGQGLFALGYWHQRAFRFEEINRRRGERANDKGAADAVVSQL